MYLRIKLLAKTSDRNLHFVFCTVARVLFVRCCFDDALRSDASKHLEIVGSVT